MYKEKILNNFPKISSYGDYENNNYGLNSLSMEDTKGNKFFFSYKTLVAFKVPDKDLVICKNMWGNTTGKHLNWINKDKTIRVDYETFQSKFNEIFNGEAL